MQTIAIIDDDVYIGNMIEEILRAEGYHTLRAYSDKETLMLLSHNKPDLVLLDLMLPGLSGEEVLPHIQNIPVIVVSAKVDVYDKVGLLLSGASDYITKPFHTKELLARITVQLRKTASPELETILAVGGLRLDLNTHEAWVDNVILHLTRTEYAILKLLMQNSTQVITKSAMLDRISQDTPDCTENSLKVHISNLRSKLREAGNKEYIENRTQALKQLTEELFRYSVIMCTDETMAMESVSLNAVLEECIAAFYAALSERGITPVIHMPEKTVIRQLNKAALSRVLGNILNNALKYSDGDLEIEMKDTGKITFTNTASRLDDVQVGKLFDRFFTVEVARNSTGLGLAIAKTLVEQMNGEITADYKNGRISVSIVFRNHVSTFICGQPLS